MMARPGLLSIFHHTLRNCLWETQKVSESQLKNLNLRQVSTTVSHRGESVCKDPSRVVAPYVLCKDPVFDFKYRHKTKTIQYTNDVLDKFTIPKPISTYNCPAPLECPDNVIVDVNSDFPGLYDCPTNASLDVDKVLPKFQNLTVSENDSNDNTNSNAKIASNLLKIRRRKIKRHFYRKMRKKFKFKIRQAKLKKNRKKERVLHKTVTSILNTGYNFDAEKYMQDYLEKAKSAGFRIDLFENQRKTKS